MEGFFFFSLDLQQHKWKENQGYILQNVIYINSTSIRPAFISCSHAHKVYGGCFGLLLVFLRAYQYNLRPECMSSKKKPQDTVNLIAKKAGIRLVQKRKDASQVEPHVKVGISHLTLPPDKIIISNFGYKKICLIHSVCNWKPFRVNGQSKTIDESIDSFTKNQKLISVVLLHHWLYCFLIGI